MFKNLPLVKNSLLIFFISTFLSCNKKDVPSDPLKLFPNKTTIIGQTSEIKNLKMGKPYDGILIDSLFIIKDKTLDEKMFAILNMNSNKLEGKTGKKGKGPNELIMAKSLNPGIDQNHFSVYDHMKNIIYSFNLDSCLNYKKYLPKVEKNFIPEHSFLQVIQLAQNLYFGTGTFEKNRFLKVSNDNKTKYLFDYPDNNKNQNIPNPYKAMAYQGQFIRQPNGNKFAFASMSSGILEIFKYNTNNEINKVKDIHCYNPKFKPFTESKGYSSPFLADNKFGFIDIYPTYDYLYVLYSGKTFRDHKTKAFSGKYVMVFNWKGEPIKLFILNKDIRILTVTKNNKRIYGIGYHPEPKLVGFKLDLIK